MTYLLSMVCVAFVASGGYSLVTGFQSFSRNNCVVSKETSTVLSATKNLIDIEDSNYRQLFRGDKYVLVDCCAPWCGPCKFIEPVLEYGAEKWKDHLIVGKFDVESDNKDLKVELLLQGVMPKSLPSLILMYKDEILTTWKGVIRPTELDAMLDKHINKKETNIEKFEEVKEPSGETVGLISFAMSDGRDDYMLRDT